LLVYLNHTLEESERFQRNLAGVLVFYFTLYKLLQTKTVVRLIADFIPKRRNSRGRLERNKFLQIKNIVESGKSYRMEYLRMMKALFPVLHKQVVDVIKTFELSRLHFEGKDGKPNREAYLKLFNNYMHEALNSGLGVVVGFKYRPASRAFQEAANRILKPSIQ
jgi:flagellar biosynthesis protein FlhG